MTFYICTTSDVKRVLLLAMVSFQLWLLLLFLQTTSIGLLKILAVAPDTVKCIFPFLLEDICMSIYKATKL